MICQPIRPASISTPTCWRITPLRNLSPQSVNDLIASLGASLDAGAARADEGATARRFKAGAGALKRGCCEVAAIDSDARGYARNEWRRDLSCISSAQAFEGARRDLASFVWSLNRLHAALSHAMVMSDQGRRGLSLRVWEQEHDAARALLASAGFDVVSKGIDPNDQTAQVWVLGWDLWPGSVEPSLHLGEANPCSQ